MTVTVTSAPALDARSALRHAVEIEAVCRRAGSYRYEVRLLDLSQSGCRIEPAIGLAPDTAISIVPCGLAARDATIRWSRDGQMGIEFVEPLHPAVADHLVANNRASLVATANEPERLLTLSEWNPRGPRR